MYRSFDGQELASRRHLLQEDLLGFEPEIAEDRDNIFLIEGADAILFEKMRGVYSGHLFLESRGKAAFDVARRALEYVKGYPIIGMTPSNNKKALWFSRQLGFERLDVIDTPVGEMVLSMYKEIKA